MVDFATNFDAAEIAPSGSYDLIPAGTYEAEIIESSRQEISKREDKGDCLVLTWKLRGGPYDGRLVWQRLNLFWTGPEKTPGKVVEIANRELSGICHAVGQVGAKRSDDLLHRPALIRIAISHDQSGQYDDRNEVKRVSALGSTTGAPPRGGSQPSRFQPPQNGNRREPEERQEDQRQESSGAPSGGGWKRPAR